MRAMSDICVAYTDSSENHFVSSTFKAFNIPALGDVVFDDLKSSNWQLRPLFLGFSPYLGENMMFYVSQCCILIVLKKIDLVFINEGATLGPNRCNCYIFMWRVRGPVVVYV